MSDTPDVKNICGGYCHAMTSGTLLKPFALNAKTTTLPKNTPVLQNVLPCFPVLDVAQWEGKDMMPEDYNQIASFIAGTVKVATDSTMLPKVPDGDHGPWLHLFGDNGLWIDDTSGAFSVLVIDAAPGDPMIDALLPNRTEEDNQVLQSCEEVWYCHLYGRYYTGRNTIYIDAGDLCRILIPIPTRNDLKGGYYWGLASDKFKPIIQTDPDAENEIRNVWPDFVQKLVTRLVFFANGIRNATLVPVAPANRVPKYQRPYPKFEYKVLGLKREDGTTSPALTVQLRKSPRLHLRRGHVRHLKEQDIWIKPTIVGQHRQGVIVHDYTD